MTHESPLRRVVSDKHWYWVARSTGRWALALQRPAETRGVLNEWKKGENGNNGRSVPLTRKMIVGIGKRETLSLRGPFRKVTRRGGRKKSAGKMNEWRRLGFSGGRDPRSDRNCRGALVFPGGRVAQAVQKRPLLKGTAWPGHPKQVGSKTVYTGTSHPDSGGKPFRKVRLRPSYWSPENLANPHWRTLSILGELRTHSRSLRN